MRVELFIVSCWVNSIFSFGMAALVLFSRPLTKVKILWALMCVSVGVWSAGLGWMSSTTNYSIAWVGSLILTGSSIWIPVLLFHTVQALLNQKTNLATILFYAAGFILNYLNFKGFLMDVRPAMGFVYYTSAKPAYSLFMLHLYSGFIIVDTILWLGAKKSSPLIRKQLMSLFWGTSLGFLGGQMTVPLVYGMQIFPWGVFFVPVYVLFVGYGMLKYQFMDFKLALKKFGLTVGIYSCLVIITLPITWPQLHIVLAYPSQILSQVITVIALFTLIFAAGPIIYSFILNRSFWLRSHSTMGLTHELKSPLANIRGAIEYLTDPLTAPFIRSERLLEYMDIIKRNTIRTESFVNELLNIAAIQDGNISIELKPFLVDDLINEIIGSYRPLVERKNITIEFAHDNVGEINGDKEKIRQVVSNLLSNAVKFSRGGCIRINVRKQTDEIACSVSDDGAGIASKNIGNIFDRFYQGEMGKNAKGSGIGLTIAKAWVEAHGGKIWAESEGEGKGTTVTFTLPV